MIPLKEIYIKKDAKVKKEVLLINIEFYNNNIYLESSYQTFTYIIHKHIL